MAHSYSALYNLPTTGLRFLLLMAHGDVQIKLFYFYKIYLKIKINLFNRGNHSRDFTYISDIVDGIILAVKILLKKIKWNPRKPDPSSSIYPFKIYNIGSNKRTNLIKYLKLLKNF